MTPQLSPGTATHRCALLPRHRSETLIRGEKAVLLPATTVRPCLKQTFKNQKEQTFLAIFSLEKENIISLVCFSVDNKGAIKL